MYLNIAYKEMPKELRPQIEDMIVEYFSNFEANLLIDRSDENSNNEQRRISHSLYAQLPKVYRMVSKVLATVR
jgi:hypothetical protein